MHATFPRTGRSQKGEQKLILVDAPGHQQGIAAALRRAFEKVEMQDDDGFEALLRRL